MRFVQHDAAPDAASASSDITPIHGDASANNPFFHQGDRQGGVDADADPACTGTANRILLSMVALHYFNRTFVYPFTTRGGKGSTLATTLAATGFCAVNGYLQARHLSKFAAYDAAWLASPQFAVGLVLYVCGMTVNVHSDRVLRNLRKPGETGYKIPNEGFHRVRLPRTQT